jgi:dihydroorotase
VSLLLKGGRILDPASGTDTTTDLLIDGGTIAKVANGIPAAGHEVIDAAGRWVTPGLIDLHVHLREPGEEYKEDIATGARAAVTGGFTAVVAMPNTKPPIDNGELVEYVKRRGEAVGLCRVLPTGAVTMGQEGKALAPCGELVRAGAVALTDDGHPVDDANLFRRALEYSQDFGVPILTHAEERALSKDGHMHEGAVSTRLGLRGIPRTAEDAAVARDVLLAEYTGGRLHVCHVSTAGAVDLIRRAKERGAHVTGEAAPHHFTLTHEAVEGFATNAKMNPPLREEADVAAVIAGLRDGTLDAIATDHAPHSLLEKDCELAEAKNGIIGLETALPLALDLWRNHGMKPLDVVARLTWGPAQVLRAPFGKLAAGAPADVTVLDPDATWTFDLDRISSKSKNSPFIGRSLRGWATHTIVGGRVVYRRN